MKVAYFINQYPMVSHTFVRREIVALEALGVSIKRYSLRPNFNELLDPDDIAEAERTHYILKTPFLMIFISFLLALLTRPLAVIRTLLLAIRIGWKSDRGVLGHLAYVVEAAVLANLCKRESIKHIHAHFGTNSATVAMLAKELSTLTYSFTAHGADELDRASTYAMKEKLRRAAFVVGVSWYVRSQLLRQIPFDTWHKIKVIHCGLGSDFLEHPTPELPTAPRFVCVGRLCQEKAQLLLIQAAKKLKDSGIDFELVLAGDGPLRPDLESAITSAGLQTKVRVTGWISNNEVKQELTAARALILPSLIEGLPVAIMEAMALGRPVISTFIAGIPELVVVNETGWLVPAGDVEALTNAMSRVLTMPNAEIKAVGRAAQLRVRLRHNVITEAEKLKALFESTPQ